MVADTAALVTVYGAAAAARQLLGPTLRAAAAGVFSDAHHLIRCCDEPIGLIAIVDWLVMSTATVTRPAPNTFE